MCTNVLLGWYDIPWDCSACHLVDKTAEDALGTSSDPQESTNKEAQEILQLVIKIAAEVNQSSEFKQRFEKLQLEMLEEIFKITKHKPQRWLSLVRTFERIIRLWHVFRKVYIENGTRFPLDAKKDVILQLFSLLEPLIAITRDGQIGDVPMTAEVYMAFAVLQSEVLNPTMPLEVFDIPPAACSPGAELPLEETEGEEEEGEREGGEQKKKHPLPSKKVFPEQLHPVTIKIRKDLRKALVQMFVGRVWDMDSTDPSPFRNATALLTPPYNTGNFFHGLRLSEGDAQFLADDKRHLAPTTDSDVANQISDSWADIRTRALAAAKTQEKRDALADPEGAKPPKRFCAGGAGSHTERLDRFASFGRTAIVGGARERNGDEINDQDVLAEVVKGEVISYRALFMQTSEVGRCFNPDFDHDVQLFFSVHVERALRLQCFVPPTSPSAVCRPSELFHNIYLFLAVFVGRVQCATNEAYNEPSFFPYLSLLCSWTAATCCVGGELQASSSSPISRQSRSRLSGTRRLPPRSSAISARAASYLIRSGVGWTRTGWRWFCFSRLITSSSLI